MPPRRPRQPDNPPDAPTHRQTYAPPPDRPRPLTHPSPTARVLPLFMRANAPAGSKPPSPAAGETDERAVMSLGDHLEDLRRRVVLGLLGVLPIFIASLALGGPILDWLVAPLRSQLRAANQPSVLQATSPFETFTAYLHISFVATVLVGSPWLIYQLWRFVAPGLYANEKRFVRILVPLSAGLTLTSATFYYTLVLPVVLSFFIGFGTHLTQPSTITAPLPEGVVLGKVPVLAGDPESPAVGDAWVNEPSHQLRIALAPRSPGGPPVVVGVELTQRAGIQQQYRVSEYVRSILTLALGFAVAFQTPVVVLLLGWAGIVTRAWLSKYRRQAILVCAVLGAVLTPADPLSMLLMFVPLYALFELGMVLLVLLPADPEARRRKAAEAPAAQPAPAAASRDEGDDEQPLPAAPNTAAPKRSDRP